MVLRPEAVRERLLRLEEVISRLEEREELKGLGGLRNILVHGYLRVDPDRVTHSLHTSPARFSAFARDVREWLQKTIG